MKKLTSKLKSLAVLGALFPALAFAQDNQVQTGLTTTGLQPLFGSSGLTGATSITQVIVEVITILLIFAGAIAVVFVIIGGYQYLTSAGNEEQAEQGKKTLINAIIGVVVIILSYTIIAVIVNLVGSGMS